MIGQACVQLVQSIIIQKRVLLVAFQVITWRSIRI